MSQACPFLLLKQRKKEEGSEITISGQHLKYPSRYLSSLRLSLFFFLPPAIHLLGTASAPLQILTHCISSPHTPLPEPSLKHWALLRTGSKKVEIKFICFNLLQKKLCASLVPPWRSQTCFPSVPTRRSRFSAETQTRRTHHLCWSLGTWSSARCSKRAHYYKYIHILVLFHGGFIVPLIVTTSSSQWCSCIGSWWPSTAQALQAQDY